MPEQKRRACHFRKLRKKAFKRLTKKQCVISHISGEQCQCPAMLDRSLYVFTWGLARFKCHLQSLIRQVKYLLRGHIELPMRNSLERCDSVTANVTDA